MKLLDFFKYPKDTSITDADSPQVSVLHRQIIKKNIFLKRLYIDIYHDIAKHLPLNAKNGLIVELGSGGGFIKEILPFVMTSDLFAADWIDHVFSAEKMPFENNSIDAFVMLDVFHHLPRASQCLKEISRCLKKGGRLIMVEPANTPWYRFFAMNFHSEPFDVNGNWNINGDGRLSSANGALPWIIFVRDRSIFENKFPELKINSIRLHTPFRYIVSGGLSYRAFVAPWMYPIIKGIEYIVTPCNFLLGFFQTIEIEKLQLK